MNFKQAEAIANLYQELIDSIKPESLNLPGDHYTKWTHNDINNFYLDSDNTIKAEFSRYRGCGEYDTGNSYTNLNDIFAE